MSKIRGKAKRYDGAPIDYVSLFNWIDGKCITQVVPDTAGNWVYDYFKDINVGITYVSNGCEPITHGEYEFAYQFNPSEDALLYYSFDGNTLDSSPSNLNGVKTGIAKFVTGRKAGTQALEFIAGCVKTLIALPVNSEKMTISLWLKTISTDVGVVYEISQDNNVNERTPALFINNSGVSKIDSSYRVGRVNDQPQYNIPSSPVSLGGDWQHILIDIDTSRVGNQEQRIYVNNVLTSTYATEFSYNSAGNIGNYVLYIGQRGGTSIPFKGTIQDMRVFNRSLTSDERLILFNE